MTEVWYTNGTNPKTKAYEYEYTSDGQIHEFIDYEAEKSTVYKYDTDNRLIGFIEYANGDHCYDFSASMIYDVNDRLQGADYYLNYESSSNANDYAWTYFYTYEDDGTVSNVRVITEKTNGFEYFSYDEYDRVSSKRNYFYLSGSSSTKFDNQIDLTYATNGD